MPKINYSKAYYALQNGEKLPRKTKKAILGRRIGKTKLNRLLKTLVLIKDNKTMYDRPIYNLPLFCPKCGCQKTISNGNMVAYPEHWENFYCVRCDNHVAYIDNSPYRHAFDYKYNNFEF